MAVAPNEIGMNGSTIRPIIQAQFDKIDACLKDPVFAMKNNKHPDKANGGFKFSFKFEGMLNNTELDTLQNGWVGWTEAIAQNDPLDPMGNEDYVTWSLFLNKNP